jgi:hypothetical protein
MDCDNDQILGELGNIKKEEPNISSALHDEINGKIISYGLQKEIDVKNRLLAAR